MVFTSEVIRFGQEGASRPLIALSLLARGVAVGLWKRARDTSTRRTTPSLFLRLKNASGKFKCLKENMYIFSFQPLTSVEVYKIADLED